MVPHGRDPGNTELPADLDLIKLQVAAEETGYSVQTLTRYGKSGAFALYRSGKSGLRVDRNELRRVLIQRIEMNA